MTAPAPLPAAVHDLWAAVAPPAGGDGRSLRRLGHAWGDNAARRLTGLFRREFGLQLHQARFGAVLDAFGGWLAEGGLGRFSLALGWRDRGLLLVEHRDLPVEGRSGGALAAGLHAGFLSALAGRQLDGRAVVESGDGRACRIAVGAPGPLAALLDGVDLPPALARALSADLASGDAAPVVEPRVEEVAA